MGHGHPHDHGNHDHSHSANKKALLIGFILIFTFMIVEFIGGILTNSLALLSDAVHMLSDAAALGLSLLALKLGEKKTNQQKTYGYKRFEILAALFNGITLVLISLYIFWEAYHRFLQPPTVLSTGMLTVASIGLFINIIVAWVLMRGDTHGNLNMRSAFLHVLGDMLGSIGAITAAILIMAFGWYIADPIASVIVAILILISAYRVTRESFHILMEGAPNDISLEKIKSYLSEFPEVISIHDMHLWTITSNFPSFSCHLVVENDIDSQAVLDKVTHYLDHEYHIEHTTIQIETLTSTCCSEKNCCN